RVLHRIVHALAGVFDVEHLVPERAQPEQVHQRTPRHAAERISGDDAREEYSHLWPAAPRPPAPPVPPARFTASPPRSARPWFQVRRATCRPTAARTSGG